MKINEKLLDYPKLHFGLKKYLLSLNRDLDKIKDSVKNNSDYWFLYNHSIYPHSTELTRIEVAILYLEDRRFFYHSGVELRSILRGFKRLILRRSFGGISTIDQQAVRISLRRYERTISRKLNELILAALINTHLSKRSILDYYIHNAYMGHRMEGCEVTAQKVFGRTAASLNELQSAFIASLLPLPFPRSVWDAYSTDPSYPFSDPTSIVSLAREFSPRWAARIEYRMKLAVRAYDFMPSNL